MFAKEYLQKNIFQHSIKQAVEQNTGAIVVIPCYIEPEITKTLDSLLKIKTPDCGVEIIIVINHSESAPEEEKTFNYRTSDEVKQWISDHFDSPYKVLPIGPIDLQKKWAGAGLARKKGMDEAAYRFNMLNRPKGIIVSLDADTLVDENYLTEIERHFISYPEHVGATISFQHQTEGLTGKHLEGIRLYEKYLDYYKNALTYIGYPNSMFTIGSAFTVTAESYVKRGGMSRRKAGEDFYFLQGLAQMGKVGEINTTSVHPSSRLSLRVPFGTGASITKWMEGSEDLTLTYNFLAFSDLKLLFDRIDMLFRINEENFYAFTSALPVPVSEFLKDDGFWIDTEDLNRNCSAPAIFKERFFQKFNAFKILKYLNFVHDKFYFRANLEKQIDDLGKSCRVDS